MTEEFKIKFIAEFRKVEPELLEKVRSVITSPGCKYLKIPFSWEGCVIDTAVYDKGLDKFVRLETIVGIGEPDFLNMYDEDKIKREFVLL